MMSTEVSASRQRQPFVIMFVIPSRSRRLQVVEYEHNDGTRHARLDGRDSRPKPFISCVNMITEPFSLDLRRCVAAARGTFRELLQPLPGPADSALARRSVRSG
jgi:hypothetical protein